jgi:ribosomal protein L16/L10AE
MKNPFRANISDENFLKRFERGAIRFYHDDVLKVKLKTEHRMKNGKGRTTHEIVEVLDYNPAPVKRQKRSRK